MHEERIVSGIAPWLWFASQAEEAAAFHVGIFPDSRSTSSPANRRTGPAATPEASRPSGSRSTAALSPPSTRAATARPRSTRPGAFLDGGGRAERCGWSKDRYGFSRQIVPAAMPRLIGDPDRTRADHAQQAMLGMVKLDIAALEAAHAG